MKKTEISADCYPRPEGVMLLPNAVREVLQSSWIAELFTNCD